MVLSRRERPLYRSPWFIFWVAFGLRLAVILIGRTYHQRLEDDHFDFGFEAGRIARSLVAGRGYGNPFNGFSGPTAWLPPLYPLLLAGCFKLFGVYSHGSAIAILGLNSLFSALVCPAVFEIAFRIFDAKELARRKTSFADPVAVWSAWLWAVYPAALQYAVHWVWEMSLTACLFTWAVVLALRMRGVGEPSDGLDRFATPVRWLCLGLVWGLIGLSNASLLLMLPASAGWILWPMVAARWQPGRNVSHSVAKGARGGASRAARQLPGVALCAVAFWAVLTPWIVRNERALHAFVPTRANFGVELWQSTHFAEYGPLPWGGAMPLWPGDPEFQRYVRVGEVAYAREKGEIAKRKLRAHPDLFLKFTAERIQMFWGGTPHPQDKHPANEVLRLLNYSVLSVAGLLGLLLALSRRVKGAGLLGLAFLLAPAVYYGVTVQPRFRHPLEPLIAILGVYLFRSTGPRDGSRSPAAGRGRL
jgi:hypothetical protein